MDNMFGLLLPVVTAPVHLTSQQSLVETIFVIVMKRQQCIMNFSGLPSNVGDTPSGSTKRHLPLLLMIKVRICRDQKRGDEDVAIKTLKFYIQ